MNITINELSNIKNKSIKKAYIRKLGIRKLGVWGIIFLFGTVAFISGFSINSYAASSSTVLPISRGGTNANTVEDAQTNLGKVNTINSKSTDNQFPSSKAVYNSILPAGGPNNLYITGTTSQNDAHHIIVLGEIPPDDVGKSKKYTYFFGQFIMVRKNVNPAGEFSCVFSLKASPFINLQDTDEIINKNNAALNIENQWPSSFPIKLGTFEYNETKLVGINYDFRHIYSPIYPNVWYANADWYLHGFYGGSLSTNSADPLFVGKRINYDAATNWQDIPDPE
ncbi:MAG: hypothetical protein LBT91_00925 [Bifidobacteriaceae bacterium]|jgi:hypothetical protein|nr:hypothetical protein [Bifidobacteriaceae bacterium]